MQYIKIVLIGWVCLRMVTLLYKKLWLNMVKWPKHEHFCIIFVLLKQVPTVYIQRFLNLEPPVLQGWKMSKKALFIKVIHFCSCFSLATRFIPPLTYYSPFVLQSVPIKCISSKRKGFGSILKCI